MCCLYACLSRHSHLLALDINNLQTEDKNSRGNICLKLKYLSHLSCYLRRRRTRPILNTCPMSILNICFPFCIHSEVKNSKISKSSFPPKFQVFASVSGDSSSVVQLCGPYTWSTGLLASLHQPTIIHLPFSWLLNFAEIFNCLHHVFASHDLFSYLSLFLILETKTNSSRHLLLSKPSFLLSFPEILCRSVNYLKNKVFKLHDHLASLET